MTIATERPSQRENFTRLPSPSGGGSFRPSEGILAGGVVSGQGVEDSYRLQSDGRRKCQGWVRATGR